MNLSTALAKPSSSLDVVTRRAEPCTSGLALPIAMLRPECANISTSFGMSPIVAMASGAIWYAAADRVDVVADPDQLRHIAGEPVKAGHDLRLELHCTGFPVHVGALRVGHIPVRAAVDPGVEVERADEISHRPH